MPFMSQAWQASQLGYMDPYGREKQPRGSLPDNKGRKHSKKGAKKHTTRGIRWSSLTQLLVRRSLVCRGESGRDPEFLALMVVCSSSVLGKN
jgi:hypothetical protein